MKKIAISYQVARKAASVLLVMTLLAACAPAVQPTQAPAAQPATQPAEQAPASSGGSASTDTLRVWIAWGDNPAQLQELFDRYGKANHLKIEVTAPVESDKILAGLSGSEPPDVIILSGGDLVKSWYREGLITPLNDLIKSSNIDVNDIYPAPLGQCKDGEQLLCLPWGADIYALFWNKDLFEEAGLDPEKAPETMEQLVEYAEKLTKKNDDGTLKQVGFIPDFSWGHSDLYARMFGGFWYNNDGTQVTLDSQPMIDALKWGQQFYNKFGVDQLLSFTSALGGYMSPDQGFYAGQVAMMVDGEWQTGPNFISKYKPELSYGVAPFPPPKDHPERKNSTVVQGTVVIIPSSAKNKEASAKLMAWMMTPEILAEEMYTNFNLPTSKKAAGDPRFKENPKFQMFMTLMSDPNAFPLVNSPISSELNDAFGKVEEQTLHANADPVPLLKEAQAKFQPMLDEALKKK